MTSEVMARKVIDQKLAAAGWVVQHMKEVNLGAASGVAVREYPTDTGPADYLLFVDRQPVGVIEAKRDAAGENLTVHEAQTERYASAKLKWRKDSPPLRSSTKAPARSSTSPMVVGYGPFVMNNHGEIRQTIHDFNRGNFGRMLT